MHVKTILKEHGLAANKKRGQNFLIDPRMPARIVELAGVEASDTVVELGVGLGALTTSLAARAERVIGLEIDAGLVRWQREMGRLPANVELRHQDLLKADYRRLAAESGGRLKILANLPYSISNPLLFKLVENAQVMEWAVLMLQKEVAERLAAEPGTKEYGVLSVLLGVYASVEPLLQLRPEQFHPRPKVDSTVVRLTFAGPAAPRQAAPHDGRLLRRLVSAAFQQRRKTLANALAPLAVAAGMDKAQAGMLLEEAGISPGQRADKLSRDEYVRLARGWAKAWK